MRLREGEPAPVTPRSGLKGLELGFDGFIVVEGVTTTTPRLWGPSTVTVSSASIRLPAIVAPSGGARSTSEAMPATPQLPASVLFDAAMPMHGVVAAPMLGAAAAAMHGVAAAHTHDVGAASMHETAASPGPDMAVTPTMAPVLGASAIPMSDSAATHVPDMAVRAR